MDKIRQNIPNFITCLNLAAGCLSIVAAFRGFSPFWGGLRGIDWAFILIGIGAAADFLDGFAARLLKAYSELGKQLDSLSDLVTFGVAPAMILFNILETSAENPWLRWLVFLIPVCGAIRLGRFNIDIRQASTFIGMPIPANAIFWIGYSSLILQGVAGLTAWYLFIPVLLIECWLMNSPVRMFSLKFSDFSLRNNYLRYLLIAATAIFCFTLQAGGLLWVIVFYVCASAAFKDRF